MARIAEKGDQVMRSVYRALSDEERAAMDRIKDLGAALWDEIHKVAKEGSRELSLAKTKVEESVMWAVKHITG